MADGTLQILGLGTSAVPLEYNVTGNQSLDLVAVNVDYDGSSAAVSWQPVIEIVSDAGHVMARGVGPTIAAGDSASVTFAPFLEGTSTSTTGGGILFDTRPQSGGFLQVTTNDAGANSFNLQSAGEMDVRAAEFLSIAGSSTVELHGDSTVTVDSQAGVWLLNISAGDIRVRNSADGGIEIHDQGTAASPGVPITSDNSYVELQGVGITAKVTGDFFYITLTTGQRLQVLNNALAPIFEVREDGSLHGKTGKSLTFDL